jgi:hypothetical protein
LEGYQAGRTFDDELVDQLEVLPEFVTTCGFANAKQGGYEADDFLPLRSVVRENEAGPSGGERLGSVRDHEWCRDQL